MLRISELQGQNAHDALVASNTYNHVFMTSLDWRRIRGLDCSLSRITRKTAIDDTTASQGIRAHHSESDTFNAARRPAVTMLTPSKSTGGSAQKGKFCDSP